MDSNLAAKESNWPVCPPMIQYTPGQRIAKTTTPTEPRAAPARVNVTVLPITDLMCGFMADSITLEACFIRLNGLWGRPTAYAARTGQTMCRQTK
jgi:hypothetical protein